jgi:hypothetical protein
MYGDILNLQNIRRAFSVKSDIGIEQMFYFKPDIVR